jgi:hypothetical protein
MLMIHSVYRSQFAASVRFIRAVPEGDEKRAQIVGAFVLEIADSLHHHHRGEDDVLWHRLEQRAPACAAHVGRMRADHAEVAELLAVVEAGVPVWTTGATAADRDRVADATQRVLEALLEHLGDEETTILPVAEATITQSEWSELGKRGRAAAPKGRIFEQLGMVLETSDPRYRDLVWSELPPPVRLLYRWFGKTRYERHRALLEGAAS